MNTGKTAVFIILLQVSLLNAFACAATDQKKASKASVTSPDGRNTITLEATGADHTQLRFTISRDGAALIGPSAVGPKLSSGGAIGEHTHLLGLHPSEINNKFTLP